MASDRQPMILVGTTNEGKRRELCTLLSVLPARLVSPTELGIDLDPEEGDRSFHENAAIKARAFFRASGVLTVAEDSGFVVDALGGEPGVHSARWAGAKDYGTVNRLILERLEGVPIERRACHYVAALAMVDTDGRLYRRSGRCDGSVALDPAGSGGFGYDPIFYVPELGRTLAEVGAEEKLAISHRGQAARRALPLLRRLLSGEPRSTGDGRFGVRDRPLRLPSWQ